MMTKTLLFDWGNTIMVDFVLPGPMCSWDQVAWVEGAENALQSLYEKYNCFLATNAGASTTREVQLALKRVDADKYFSGIFLASEIGFEKPEAGFFTAITERMGFPPETFIMIGDNYFKDCVGAKNAGMKTVLFNANRIKGPFPLADAVIYSFDELPDIIENL
jgi:HAD superfamily hydrolase (TIGR01662 family)